MACVLRPCSTAPKLMLQNPGQVIAKFVIPGRISEDTPDCTESSLKTHISHLRTKLREVSEKECIESVWEIGFRFSIFFRFLTIMTKTVSCLIAKHGFFYSPFRCGLINRNLFDYPFMNFRSLVGIPASSKVYRSTFIERLYFSLSFIICSIMGEA